MNIQEILNSDAFKNLNDEEQFKARWGLYDKISQGEKFKALPTSEQHKVRQIILSPTAEVKDPWFTGPAGAITGAITGGILGGPPGIIPGLLGWTGMEAAGGATEYLLGKTNLPSILKRVLPFVASAIGPSAVSKITKLPSVAIRGIEAQRAEETLPIAETIPIKTLPLPIAPETLGKTMGPGFVTSKTAEMPFISKETKTAPNELNPSDFNELNRINKTNLPPLKEQTKEQTKEQIDDITLLHSGLPISSRVKVPERAKRIATALHEQVGSPYEVLKSPAGQQIWQATYEADKAKAFYVARANSERLKNITIKPGSEESYKIGTLLDKYEDLSNVPPEIINTLTPKEKQAFQFMRQKWNEMGDMLIDMKLMPPGRRLKSYFFRVFDKETIYNAWKDEKDVIEAGIEAGKKNKEDLKRLAKLNECIKEYEKTGTILWDVVPKKLSAPFLKERKGAKGYSYDAVKAFDLYSYYFARKIFDEPAVKKSLELMNKLPLNERNYARWYLRDFLGMNKQTGADDLSKIITSYEYLSKLGFNTRSALVNATQQLNNIIEIGPKWTTIGALKALTPEGREIFAQSGHVQDIPGMYYGQIAKGLGKVKDIAMYLFNKMEYGNRIVAYLGARERALAKGKTVEEANRYADEVVRKTQFLYGRVGMPKYMRTAVGRVGGQFTTFSVKQIELFSNWIKNNPMKFISYIMIAEGAREGLYHTLGIDLSNALGIGLDLKEATKGLIALGRKDLPSAEYHARLTVKPGGGVFPSGFFPALHDAADLLRGDYEKVIPTQIERLWVAGKALKEGQIGGQYPIRSEETLKELVTPYELFTRTFLGRTKKEAETNKAITAQRMGEKMIKNVKGDIKTHLRKGNIDKALELADKYSIDITDELAESAQMEKLFTSRERLEYYKNKYPSLSYAIERLEKGE